MRTILPLRIVIVACALGLGTTACGDSAGDSTRDATGAESADKPRIVVTTNILGDIISETVGELADVEVIMPIGADPHDFAPSAKQAEAMENADLLVINGAGFEEGMRDIITSVEESGTPIFGFADQIELLEFTGEHSGEDEHSGDEEHPEGTTKDQENSDQENSDEEHSDEAGTDPHIWTDPARMITAVEAFGVRAAELDGIDGDALATLVDDYVEELTTLDSEMETRLSSVPADQRVLVTNHEVFGYFADRFGFEIVGAVIPSLSTSAEPSAAEIDALAELIDAEGIPAIFGDTSGSTQLAEALADSVGNDVQVVVLFSESLGEPGSGADTYIGMMSTNATLISQALTPA